MAEKNQNWWKPGVEIFSQISGYIVVPLVVALIVGKKLDVHYGTQPWLLLALAALGFLITCVGMVRVIRKYMKKLKETEINNENGNE